MADSKSRRNGSVNGCAHVTATADAHAAPAMRSSGSRAAILRAADELFSDLGYDATTYQLIADRLGVTRTAVNYHFPNKRTLYQEVVSSKAATIVHTAAENALSASTLLDELAAFVGSLTQAHTQQRSDAAFLVTSMVDLRRHPVLRDGAADPLAETRGFLRSAVDRAVERGEVSAGVDRPAVVEMLLALVWGIGFYAGFVDGGRSPLVNQQFQKFFLTDGPGRVGFRRRYASGASQA